MAEQRGAGGRLAAVLCGEQFGKQYFNRAVFQAGGAAFGRGGLCGVVVFHHCGHVQRGQPHRRPGWPGGFPGGAGGRRDGGVCLCHRALAVCTLSAAAFRAGGERGDGVLRGHVRRVFGLFVVQRGTGAGVYG